MESLVESPVECHPPSANVSANLPWHLVDRAPPRGFFRPVKPWWSHGPWCISDHPKAGKLVTYVDGPRLSVTGKTCCWTLYKKNRTMAMGRHCLGNNLSIWDGMMLDPKLRATSVAVCHTLWRQGNLLHIWWLMDFLGGHSLSLIVLMFCIHYQLGTLININWKTKRMQILRFWRRCAQPSRVQTWWNM